MLTPTVYVSYFRVGRYVVRILKSDYDAVRDMIYGSPMYQNDTLEGQLFRHFVQEMFKFEKEPGVAVDLKTFGDTIDTKIPMSHAAFLGHIFNKSGGNSTCTIESAAYIDEYEEVEVYNPSSFTARSLLINSLIFLTTTASFLHGVGFVSSMNDLKAGQNVLNGLNNWYIELGMHAVYTTIIDETGSPFVTLPENSKKGDMVFEELYSKYLGPIERGTVTIGPERLGDLLKGAHKFKHKSPIVLDDKGMGEVEKCVHTLGGLGAVKGLSPAKIIVNLLLGEPTEYDGETIKLMRKNIGEACQDLELNEESYIMDTLPNIFNDVLRQSNGRLVYDNTEHSIVHNFDELFREEDGAGGYHMPYKKLMNDILSGSHGPVEIFNVLYDMCGKETWSAALGELKEPLQNHVFDEWFGGLFGTSKEDVKTGRKLAKAALDSYGTHKQHDKKQNAERDARFFAFVYYCDLVARVLIVIKSEFVAYMTRNTKNPSAAEKSMILFSVFQIAAIGVQLKSQTLELMACKMVIDDPRLEMLIGNVVDHKAYASLFFTHTCLFATEVVGRYFTNGKIKDSITTRLPLIALIGYGSVINDYIAFARLLDVGSFIVNSIVAPSLVTNFFSRDTKDDVREIVRESLREDVREIIQEAVREGVEKGVRHTEDKYLRLFTVLAKKLYPQNLQLDGSYPPQLTNGGGHHNTDYDPDQVQELVDGSYPYQIWIALYDRRSKNKNDFVENLQDVLKAESKYLSEDAQALKNSQFMTKHVNSLMRTTGIDSFEKCRDQIQERIRRDLGKFKILYGQ